MFVTQINQQPEMLQATSVGTNLGFDRRSPGAASRAAAWWNAAAAAT